MRPSLAAGLRLTAIAGLAGALAIGPAVSAGASTNYLARASTSLNHGHMVFLSRDLPGYYSDQLATKVVGQPGRLIALVAVPAAAIDETGGNPQAFADELNAMTGHRLIIGVAFVKGKPPNSTAAYRTSTSRIDQQQSDSQMDSATVASNPEAVLTAFGENVQQWLQDNRDSLRPIPKPTGPGSHPSGTTGQNAGTAHGPSIAGLIFLMGAALLIAGGAILLLRRKRAAEQRSQKFPDPPSTITEHVRRIRRMIPRLQELGEGQAGATLEEICTRIAMLFDALRTFEADHKADPDRPDQTGHKINLAVKDYDDKLGRIERIATLLIEMQEQGPEYWHGDPEENLRMGRDSFTAFDRELLEAIRDAHDGKLRRVIVDTRFLEVTAR